MSQRDYIWSSIETGGNGVALPGDVQETCEHGILGYSFMAMVMLG